jgi:uncharacterized protein YjbI with pentapeptide repeats
MRRAWEAISRTGLLSVAAAIAGVVGLLWLVLVAAPPWFVHDRSLEGLKAQNQVRTTLLQGLGGVVLLVGAYFTSRQLQTAREGQITERFTRAIDQLGHAQLDVRLGGIYALERIARDSPADHATIGEVLTAFVRSHAPWPPSLSAAQVQSRLASLHIIGQYVATAPIDEVPELQVRAADVQASLTVLGRGGFASLAEDQRDRLDLHAVDLRHAGLRGADLEGANLRGAHLEEADLFGADLEGADLGGAHLEQANLLYAHLEQANLYEAHLEEANLIGAHLEGANLRGAHLERARLGVAYLGGAELDGAFLRGAWLGGADLEGAHLSGAHLEGARAVERTIWPEEFDWRAGGVIVEGGDTPADGP